MRGCPSPAAAAAGAARFCPAAAFAPPSPPSGVVTKDITDRTMIDNRQWINNSRYIDTYIIHDKRVQTLIQKNPVLFFKNARIDRRPPDFFPPGTYI